jgi:SAM-dependent methyltransferase
MQCGPAAEQVGGAGDAPGGILAALPAGPGRHSSWDFVDSAGVLAALDLRPGLIALDLGCGRGEWARAIAARVGPTGCLIALDVWAEALVFLRRAGLAAVRGDLRRPLPFAAASADRVLLALLAHHFDAPARAGLFRQIARVLRPAGRLVMVEFAAMPPPPGPPLARRLPGAALRVEVRDAGLALRQVLPVAPHVDAWVIARG